MAVSFFFVVSANKTHFFPLIASGSKLFCDEPSSTPALEHLFHLNYLVRGQNNKEW